ncbi:MAG: T9SS type A sorting domain-containing protein [Aureispira sp.]|nr:T9SS type A sorting domain-containing protein [Aureispira sp.]
MKLIYKLLFTIVLSNSFVQAQITLDSTTIDTSTIITGLDIPWEIQWGPDNWIWTTERYGRISRINPNTGAQNILLDLSATVHQAGESGLLGLALHPNFADTAQVFLVYTYLDNSVMKERIVRYDYDSTNSNLHTPLILLDDIPAHNIHDGSRLLILPDHTLLITTGDANIQNNSQSLSSLNGKMLRLHLDGTIPSDNPIPNSPIWSWGHRNPQGLFLGPNNIVYSSEHGPGTDDEINIIEKGRNYGWPNVHGYCDLSTETQFCLDSNVYEPIQAWTPTVATSDIVWYNHPAIPEFQNSILLTTLKNKELIQIKMSSNHQQAINNNALFTNYWGRLRDICIAPDGRIFLATNGPSSSNTNPFTHSIIELKNSNYTAVKPLVWQEAQPKLYPNPSTGISTLEIPHEFVDSPFVISNLLEQIVYQGSLNKKTLLNGALLSEGLYIIHILHPSEPSTLKWLVQKS